MRYCLIAKIAICNIYLWDIYKTSAGKVFFIEVPFGYITKVELKHSVSTRRSRFDYCIYHFQDVRNFDLYKR